MSGEMRLRLVIDGETQEAAVAVNQVTTAISRMETTAKATAPAVASAMKQVSQGAAEATKLTAQQLGQMQFQLQDIAVGLTSGQSPFTVMMQQGSQLAGMFQSGTGVLGALRAVGQGLVQFLTNPLNLAVMAFGLAAQAAASYFSTIGNGSTSVEEALSRQEDLVKRIRDRYTEAGRAAEAYGITSRLTDLREQAKLTEDRRAALTGQLSGLASAITGDRVADPLLSEREREAVLIRGLTEDYGIFAGAIVKLTTDVQNGGGDVLAFRQQIEALIASSGNSPDVKALGARIIEMAQGSIDAAAALQTSVSAQKELEGSASALDKALLGVKGSADGAAGPLNGVAAALRNLGAINPSAMPLQAFPQLMSPIGSGKALLDLIGMTEGTDIGRGYNETLMRGKFTGGPVDLVSMKLSEVLDLQKRMLADPSNTFNSSAVGRYQITAETLRDFMPKLGFTGDTIFSSEVQDKIALAIANAAGRSVDNLQGRWTSLKNVSPDVVLGAFDKSSTDRSATAAEQERARLAKETADEKERELEIHKAIAEQTKKQTEEQRKANQVAADMQRSMIAFTDQFRGLTDGLASTIARAKESGLSWTKSMSAGLDALKDKALNFLDSFIDKAADAALWGPKGTSGGGLLGGILGSIGGLFNPMQNALGNAFQGGSVVAFANGGVFDQPTYFPMSQGRTGLFAEAGPEAILPLSRTASGHLGVRSQGGGGSAVFNMQINNRAGAEVTSSAQPNGSGGLDIELFIERKVEQVLGKEDTMRGLAGRLNLRNPTKQWGKGW